MQAGSRVRVVLDSWHVQSVADSLCPLVQVLWPLDEEWYKGVIFSYDSHTKKHLVSNRPLVVMLLPAQRRLGDVHMPGCRAQFRPTHSCP